MLVHADIYHYKSIEEAHLSFRPINLIVGPNGVGKSNLVDAISFIHEAATEGLDKAITKRHGIESIRQWSRRKPFNMTFEFSFHQPRGSGRYRLVLSSARGGYKIMEEAGEWTGDNPFVPRNRRDDSRPTKQRTSFRRGADNKIVIESDVTENSPANNAKVSDFELYISSLSGPFRDITSFYLGGLVEEITSFASYSIYPNTLRQPQIVSREETLFPDGSNLATIIKKINGGYKSNKDSILSSLQTILPIISDIRVGSGGGYYFPVVRVREENGDLHDFNMSQVSDGTLRILGLLAAFYQTDAPNKIAIEEPEQMLHPGALPVLADAAREYVGFSDVSNRQVFITTHSPGLLDLFDPESIIWVSFAGGVTKSGSVNQRQLDLVKRQLFSPGEILTSEGFFS